MNRERAFKITLTAMGILIGGMLGGMLIGDDIRDSVRYTSAPPPPSDPVERYELGRDSYKPPSVKRRTSYAHPGEPNYDYGKVKDGKRLLVPAEPARKKERVVLDEQEAAQKDYFGEDSIDQDAAISEYQSSLDAP